MILQSLYQLYDRLADDPTTTIAPIGFAPQQISFRVILKPDGSLFDIKSAQQPNSNGKLGNVPIEVPAQEKRTSGIKPQFMCDKLEYLLGFTPDDKEPGFGNERFESFKALHLQHEKEINCEQYSTLCRFLEMWSPDDIKKHPHLKEIKSGFGIFNIQGETHSIHQSEKIKSWWKGHITKKNLDTTKKQCLITGVAQPIQRIHPDIKGFKSSIALVGIQEKTSYESYGLSKTENCPIGATPSFKYATALNWLTNGKGKAKHRFYIGDTSCVFWTDKPSIIEDTASFFFQSGSTIQEDAQDENIRSKIKVLLQSIQQGGEILKSIGENPDATQFYILGLEQPNPGRFSIRFFYQSSVSDFLLNIRAHYEDISIIREYETPRKKIREQPIFPSQKDLLNQTALKLSSGKLDYKTIPPLLAGALMRAILENTRYPEGLYSAVIRRIRADRTINYFRACIIKGTLTRNHKLTIPTMLDKTNTDPAYLLGRLFSVFEQSQRQAHEFKIERTIRESFYSSASATPKSIYPRLHKLHMHHLRKLTKGSQKFYEDLICEILGKFTTNGLGAISYPAILTLTEQGVFAIGYYHQLVPFKSGKQQKETQKSTSEESN